MNKAYGGHGNPSPGAATLQDLLKTGTIMKKIIILGLLGGIVALVVGMLAGEIYQILIPSVKTEFENENIFRSWKDPRMLLFFIHPLVWGVALAWVWTKVKSVINADSDLKKGLYFGSAVWLTCTVPGMIISYASFRISLAMIINWTTGGLIELLCLGILFAKTLKVKEL